MKKRVYLDHAATTPIDPRVLEVMLPFFIERFGNPGSIHKEGVFAKSAVLQARNAVAALLGSHSDEIIFTSGGTESNALAVLGAVNAVQKAGRPLQKIHVITSAIEHSSVKDVCKELEQRGTLVSYIPVDENGSIRIDYLKKALWKETRIISVMYANNEIGTIQPIREIAKIIRKFKKEQGIGDNEMLFHCDASQTPSYLDVRVEKLGVDLLTLDGQKIYGPKGIGALYKKRGIMLHPLLFGGHQEFDLRPGTENVPGIVGFAKALELACGEREVEVKRMTALRDYFIERVLNTIENVELNGDTETRIANNVNISFLRQGSGQVPATESEWIVLQLDAAGIAAGSKSACLSGEESGSYVVAALGKSDTHAKSSVRFTLGKSTTKKELDYVVDMLGKILNPATKGGRVKM